MAVSEFDGLGPSADGRFDAEQQADGEWVITLAGEVDLASEQALRESIERAVSHRPPRLVFDLSGVEFIDSSGIAQLVAAAGKVAEVSVRNPSRIAQRVIEVSGLAGILATRP